MINELKEAVKLAEAKMNDADIAIQALQKYFVFEGFWEGEEPVVSGTNSNEIILEYRGHEMDIREAVERMDCYGYISKYDFKCDW